MATGDLVHILHNDYEVHPALYNVIADLASKHPSASLLVTSYRKHGQRDDSTAATGFYEGRVAAMVLLDSTTHACGSVVISRRAIEQAGGFRPEFEYCPDEEAYLRYASLGGLAYDSRPLYDVGIHPRQARLATWRQPDFVAVYLSAREEGARRIDTRLGSLALATGARNVISACMTLALGGETAIASARLEDLHSRFPACGNWRRFRIAKQVVRWPFLARLAQVRRRLLARSPHG